MVRGLATLKEVAQTAGVSISTASRAIRAHPDVNAETRTRVLRAAEELGFYPSALARALVLGRSMSIAVMVSDITNPFYPELAKGIEDAANGLGYAIILCNTEDDPVRSVRYLERLLSQRIDGIVHASVSGDEAALEMVVKAQVPLVIANRRPRKMTGVDMVVVDNFQGAMRATQHLIAKGRRRIAHLAGLEYASLSEERLTGYLKALRDAGLAQSDDLVLRGPFTSKSGYERTMRLLAAQPPPDAILAVNDIVALGALDAIAATGLRVPEDVAVVGFDNIDLASRRGVQLTTVSQNIYHMGQVALELLLDAVRDPESHHPQEVVLDAELIVRKTSG